MDSFEQDDASGLFDGIEPPCISLYQPTHRRHPDNQQDPIRFRNLVKELQSSLLQTQTPERTEELLSPFRALASDEEFWKTTREGLAVFGAQGVFRTYKLQRPVDEIAVVAESFHLKPLTRLIQSSLRYQILALSRKSVQLYTGDRDTLDEIVLSPKVPRSIEEALGTELTAAYSGIGTAGTFGPGSGRGQGHGQGGTHHGQGGRSEEVEKDDERYFREVDRAILEHNGSPSSLPLILATLPEHREMFHRVSHNPRLLSHGIDASPPSVSLDALRTMAWAVVEPFYQQQLEGQLDHFKSASAHGRGDHVLATVATAVATGRVATLFVDAERVIPGRVDSATGHIILADMARPDVDDVLDDLAALARHRGGKVFIVSKDQCPSDTGVAAIYRY